MSDNKLEQKPDNAILEHGLWEVGEKNSLGQKSGEWKSWITPNNCFYSHTFFDNNGVILSMTQYHEDGTYAIKANYKNGLHHGAFYIQKSSTETPEYFWNNVDENAFSAILEFDFRDIFSERYFNYEGEEIYEYDNSGIEHEEAPELLELVINEKLITGKVFKNQENDQGKFYNFPIKNYTIALLSHRSGGLETLKLASKKCSFQIVLSEEELKKYGFIEIRSDNYYKVVAIDAISENTIHIILQLPPKKCTGIDKPAIYLYPETTQEIVVEHFFKGKILNTYPKYNQNWKVIAEPNGVLLNITDNRKYNYLFWDGTYTFPESHYDYKEGFYVTAENTVYFLHSTLTKIGLNETEINDFVVYWLPQLSKNDINFIHFWINDNIDNCSILTITPKPETSIRLFMEFTKHTENTKRLPEQKLPTFERKGFTMVEWGGGLIATDVIE